MKIKRALCAAALCALLLGATMGRSQETLSAEATRVVDYLLNDWRSQMHSTSIALAMANLSMATNDDVRMEVGKHFRANPGLANNIQFWGANNYILSNEEKRIAKQIVNTFAAEEALPSVVRLAAELEIDAHRLRERLTFMTRAGLLTEESTGSGYGLADKYASWGGPLRYNFHTITRGDQKPFDVW